MRSQSTTPHKVVILAGGLGSRLAEETHLKPKPMIEIGGRPMLWHIAKIYSFFGITEFIICCGYKGYVIKEYFANYSLHSSDVTFHMDKGGQMEIHRQQAEPWKITLVDTGELTNTGGRLARIREYVGNETFCFTYGDGLADVDIQALIEHHGESKCMATLTAVQPPGRYGALSLDGDRVHHFQEKPQGDMAWINGGFFILEPGIFDFLNGDSCSWEVDVMPKLAEAGYLGAFRHRGFWQAMDTLRDRNYLDSLWSNGCAPWKIW